MTGSDIAMLALTLAGFLLVAMLPYAAFRLIEVVETAWDRTRERRAETHRLAAPPEARYSYRHAR